MRLGIAPLVTLLLVTLSASGRASTIESFIIVSAVNPQVQHGTYDSGETYTGTLTLDTSLIPATGAFSIGIPTFDYITHVSNGFTESAPAFGDFATLSGTPVQIGGHTFSYDILSIDSGFVELDFLEPLGVFHGGAILYAFEANAGSGYVDTHGTALLVDPLIDATPEPATILPMLGGLVLFGFRRRLRKPEPRS
jgi:hypothetical protein